MDVLGRKGAAVGPLLVILLGGCAREGSAPTLDNIEDQVGAVGRELVVELRATDPDGDDLQYAFSADIDGIGNRASISVRPDGNGVFRWTPVGEDVGTWFVDFTVSDGRGDDTITALVDVQASAGGSAPVFRQPLGSGTTLDLAADSCLQLDVVVEDPDDAALGLGQGDPVIAGAELAVDGGNTGTWSWCPSKTQVESERFPLTLTADDGHNPTTLKNYLIVLRKSPGEDCAGEAPVVTHQSRDVASLLDVEVFATVSDDLGLKHAPLLYYSTQQPGVPIDFASLDVVEMERVDGDDKDGTYAATLPNPVAGGSQGDFASLYYIITAGDNDDADGSCDHVTDAPADGSYSVTVTHPGGSGGAPSCAPCSSDAQCGVAGDRCAIVGNQGASHCLTSCETNVDCDSDSACVEVLSVDGVVSRQCQPLQQTCKENPPPVCEDDLFEHNDTTGQADARGAFESDVYEGLVSCVDDDDWFRVELSEDSLLSALIDGVDAANLNVALHDAQGNAVAVSEEPGSLELVEQCVPPGFYYVRVYGFGALDSPYDLLIDHVAQTCVSTCEDDEFEDNDSVATATYASIDPEPFEAFGALCSDDRDFYEIELFDGETIDIDLLFDDTGADTDLDLHFYDPDGVDLTPCSEEDASTCSEAQGQSTTSDEHYRHTVDQPDCGVDPCSFYVAVHGWAGAQNEYLISIALQ